MGAAVSQQRFDLLWAVDEGQVLGKGNVAVVYVCTQRCAPEKRYALKDLSADLSDIAALNRMSEELRILKALGCHKDIVSLVDSDDTRVGKMRLVLELCEGGVLHDRIQQLQRYPERDARSCCTNLVNAVAYIHSKGIMHRDIQLESILLAGTWSNSAVKISGFGYAKVVRDFPKSLLWSRSVSGSDLYVAPEVLWQQSHGCEVDMWALGVVVYAMLSGLLPCGLLYKWHRQIVDGEIFGLPDQAWRHLSGGARDLIMRLLRPRASDRLTAAQALCHPWLRPPTPAHSSVVRSDSLLLRVGECSLACSVGFPGSARTVGATGR
uniref:Protein kinase domain-containing protein n=1 Tax=Zooxanthella nutricula TaxID=1333877 RepID=A0A6U6KRZ7_9DINO